MSVQSWHTRRSPTPWTLLLTLAQHPIKAGIHGFSPLLSHPVPVNKTENPHVAFNDWPHRKSSRFPQVHRIRYWNENCFPFIFVNFPTRSPTPPTRVRLPRGLQANSGSYYVWKFFFFLPYFILGPQIWLTDCEGWNPLFSLSFQVTSAFVVTGTAV